MGIEPTWPAWEAGALPLSYTREYTGANGGTRTRDLRITNALLYQLSYISITL